MNVLATNMRATERTVHTQDAPSDAHPFRRAAGLGGLVFLAAVVIENVLRAPMPQPGAPLAEIARYYGDRATALTLSQGFYAVAIPALLVFAVGTCRVLSAKSKAAEPWAWIGAIGLALMTPSFGLVIAFDALFTSTPEALSPGMLATVLWRLKMGVFIVNVVALSTGLAGLGIATRIANVGPRWVGALAVIGALLGLASAVRLRAGVEGSPWGLLGFGAFLSWLVFLTVTSIGHLRAKS